MSLRRLRSLSAQVGRAHHPDALAAVVAAAEPLTLQAELELDCRCGVGEGLFWDADDQLLRFLDIPGKTLYAYDPITGVTQTWNTPEQPGTWAKCESSTAGYIVAFETGFALFNPQTGAIRRCDMGKLTIDNANGGRLNDGRCDRQGRLVCGGYNDASGAKQSSLYQVTPADLSVRKLIDTPITCGAFRSDRTAAVLASKSEEVVRANK